MLDDERNQRFARNRKQKQCTNIHSNVHLRTIISFKKKKENTDKKACRKIF